MKGKSRDMIMFSILSTDLQLWFLLVWTILNFHQMAHTLVHQMVPWKGDILAFWCPSSKWKYHIYNFNKKFNFNRNFLIKLKSIFNVISFVLQNCSILKYGLNLILNSANIGHFDFNPHKKEKWFIFLQNLKF
jgi:hypothetical protein